MDKLNEKGVSTRPATHAIHMLSFTRININSKKNLSQILIQQIIAVFHFLCLTE